MTGDAIPEHPRSVGAPLHSYDERVWLALNGLPPLADDDSEEDLR